MATVSAFSTLNPIYRTKPQTCRIVPSHSLTLPIKNFHIQSNLILTKNKGLNGMRILRSVEGETLVTQEGDATVVLDEQQPVSVPISPSDKLTMYFQADGTMNEAAIPTVSQALEGTEGIVDLKIQVIEGIASVELKKQTTVQSTGVAASLVEILQGSGFKLQTLNLSFEDEEDILVNV